MDTPSTVVLPARNGTSDREVSPALNGSSLRFDGGFDFESYASTSHRDPCNPLKPYEWMGLDQRFQGCTIKNMKDHAASHVLGSCDEGFVEEYSFVTDFNATYGQAYVAFAEWLEDMPVADALVHVYYLTRHFGGIERPACYVRAVCQLYEAAFKHNAIRNAVNIRLQMRDSHFAALFGYIEHVVSTNANHILRETYWRAPHYWLRNVRKHMRLHHSAPVTPATTPSNDVIIPPTLFSGSQRISSASGAPTPQSGSADTITAKAARRDARKRHFVSIAEAKIRAAYKAQSKYVRKLKRDKMRSVGVTSRVPVPEPGDWEIDWDTIDAQVEQDRFYDALARLSLKEAIPTKQSGVLRALERVAPIALGGVAVAAFVRLCERVGNAHQKAGASVIDTAAEASGLCRTLRETFAGIVQQMKSAYKAAGAATWWVLGATMLVAYLVHGRLGITTTVCALLVGLLKDYLGAAWNSVAGVFRQGHVECELRPSSARDARVAELEDWESGITSGPIAQAGADMLPRALTGIFLFTAFKSGRQWQDTLMRRLSHYDRASDGIDSFCKWLQDAIQDCVNWVLSFFGPKRVQWFKNTKSAFVAAQREVEVLDALMLAPDGGVERADACVRALRTIAGLREVYRGTPMERPVQELHVRVVNHINTVQGSLQARNNFRQEPVMAVLRSKPGVGKTVMSVAFVAACLMEGNVVVDPEDLEDVTRQVWSRSTSEYWNGYTGQKAIVIDDIFQTVQDHTNVDNDYINIIRMVGSFALPLNMADLTSKGREYFRSHLILGTTNIDNVGGYSKCIVDETALLRRMKHVYDITVRPEYALPDGKLDYAAFEREVAACVGKTGFEAYPWHIWEARTWDLATNAGATRAGPEFVSMQSLIEMIGRDIRACAMGHELAKASVENLVKGFKTAPPPPVAQAGDSALGGSVPPDNDLVGFTPSILEQGRALALSNLKEDRDARLDPWLDMQRDSCPTALPLPGSSIASFEPDAPRRPWHVAWGATLLMFDRYCKFAGRIRDAFDFGGLVGLGVLTGQVVRLALHVVTSALKAVWGVVSGVGKKLFGGNKKESKWVNQSNRPVTGKPQRLSFNNLNVQSLDNKLANKVYGDSYCLYVETDDGIVRVHVGQVLAVGGHVLLQPAHFTNTVRGAAKPTDTVVMRSAVNHTHVIRFTVSQYLGFPRVRPGTEDVEFFSVPNTVRSFKMKAHHFIGERDLPYVSGMRVRLDVAEPDDEAAVRRSQRYVHLSEVASKSGVIYDGYVHNRGWKYRGVTQLGNCGAPLMLVQDRFHGAVVLGVHVAAWDGAATCFAPVVTREMVESALAKLNVGTVGEVEDKSADDLIVQSGRFGFTFEDTDNVHLRPGPPPEPQDYRGSGSFMPLYLLSRGPVFAPTSKYYKTELHGLFGPCPVQPAKLAPFVYNDELIYPMLNAYEPYMTELRHVDYPWLRQAVHEAMSPFTVATRNHPRVLLSFEEAVAGVPGLGMRSLPRNTSAGFPWTLKYKKGKKEMFGFEGDYVFDTPAAREVAARVDEVIDAAKKGQRLMHICSDFPKDELRSHEKVLAGKTRMISGTSVDYSIACRMYFGAFVAAVNSTHKESGLCPGICPYSDWPDLWSAMQSKGVDVFDGDFKGFDASQQPGVLLEFLHYINKWYGDDEEGSRVRNVLFLDLVNSRHMCGRGKDQRWLVQWTKCMPSGHFLTSTINSMYSMTVLVSAFGVLTGQWGQFWRHVYAATLGDDNVVNVSPEAVGVYNQVTVADFVRDYFFMEYTSGRKGQPLVPSLRISDITFLCRSFAIEGGNVVCPLKLESFLYTCYYCKNRILEKEILPDNLEFALEELSMHDPATWDHYAPTVCMTLIERYMRATRYVPEKTCYLEAVRSRTETGW